MFIKTYGLLHCERSPTNGTICCFFRFSCIWKRSMKPSSLINRLLHALLLPRALILFPSYCYLFLAIVVNFNLLQGIPVGKLIHWASMSMCIVMTSETFPWHVSRPFVGVYFEAVMLSCYIQFQISGRNYVKTAWVCSVPTECFLHKKCDDQDIPIYVVQSYQGCSDVIEQKRLKSVRFII